MPIKGFKSLEEQTKFGAIELYGVPWVYKGSRSKYALHPTKRILPQSKVPYICDETGVEFFTRWGDFGTQGEVIFKKPKFYKNTKLAVQEKRNILTKKQKFNILKEESKVIEPHLQDIGKSSNDNQCFCPKCLKSLEYKFFNKKVGEKQLKRNICKICDSNRETSRKQKIKNNPDNHIKITINTLFTSTKTRSKEKDLEHSLTKKDIEQMFCNYCPILGYKFEFFKGAFYPYSASIDRLDSSKGYTKENCKIISFKANELKNNGTIQQIKYIIDYMEFGITHFNIDLPNFKYDTHTVSHLIEAAKQRAKKKNILFKLSKKDIIPLFGRYCPIFGHEYIFHQNHPQFASPSIDKFDPNDAYTPNNIRIISHHANTIKGRGTVEEFKKVLKYMEENNCP